MPKPMVTAHMARPGLRAVEVLDEEGGPFLAVWKDPEVKSKRRLPDDLDLDRSLSSEKEAFRKEEKVGTVRIFRFIERMHTLVDEIAGKAKPLDGAAEEMAAVAESLSANSG